ncbi:hypothetical protein RvY_10178-2 [Ramazzottius varieornatus]|nr:hypothetical protein RvY_10178-2 [Ramazzottius varieornatus]
MTEIVDMNPSSASLAAHLEYSAREKSTRRKFGLEKDVLLAEAVLSHNPYESDVPHVEWKEIVEALNDIPLFETPLDVRAVRNHFDVLVKEFSSREANGGRSVKDDKYRKLDRLLAEILGVDSSTSRRNSAAPEENRALKVDKAGREEKKSRKFNLEKDILLAEAVKSRPDFETEGLEFEAWKEIVAKLNAIPLFEMPLDVRAVRDRFDVLVNQFKARNASASDDDTYRDGKLDEHLAQILGMAPIFLKRESTEASQDGNVRTDYTGREIKRRRKFSLEKDVLLAKAVKLQYELGRQAGDAWRDIVDRINDDAIFEIPLDVRYAKARLAALLEEYRARKATSQSHRHKRYAELDELMADICDLDAGAVPCSNTKASQESRRDSELDYEKFHRQAGLFADFVMLVVPKVGQESARWKYDVRKEDRILTVYRLGYKEQTAVVNECLCLQFRTDASDPSAYSMIPTFSVRGQKADTSLVTELLGKTTLTSPLDLQILLDHLVEDQENRYEEARQSKARKQPALQKSSFPSLFKRLRKRQAEEAFTDKKSKKKRLEDDSEEASKEPVEYSVVADEEPRKRRRRRKAVRTLLRKEIKETRLSGQQSDSSQLAPTASDGQLSVPGDSPLCGGTIFSSQYWMSSAPDRVRLKCAKTVFVDKGFFDGLPNFSETTAEELFDESVKYGRALGEHLLGGSETIVRSFGYSASGTCPITKEELTDHVCGVVDAVIEHMQYSFSLDKAGDVREATLAALRPKMNASYKDERSVVVGGRKPSDFFLRDHLKQNSYPDPQKTQVAFGFDFFVSKERLTEIEKGFRDGTVQTANPYGRYGMEVIAEVVGGMDVYREGLKHVTRGGMALLGDDIVEAVYLRTKKTFRLDEMSLSDFRTHITDCHLCRAPKFHLAECTTVMASVLFPPESTSSFFTLVPGAEDPPAKPGYNYWTTPAPHRTCLSLNSEFYMDKIKLAEYQRYMGPESSRKNKDWTVYLKILVHHAVGGEEAFLKMSLERRKAGRSPAVLDASLNEAIIEHVVELFKAPEVVSISKVRAFAREFYKNELAPYDKGITRWHLPELDQRPKAETVALLEAQEYWRTPAPDRTQLRPGHHVYIKTKALENIASYFGPQGKDNDIKKYAYALLVHMLGGRETTWKLWKDRKFSRGLQGMFVLDDLIAVCLHSDKVYHLTVTISPLALLRYACAEIHQYECQQETNRRKAAEGSRSKPPRSLLHKALEET